MIARNRRSPNLLSTLPHPQGDFATTWSRGRRESGNSAEQWVSDLRTISTLFTCLAVEGDGGEAEADAEIELELYTGLFGTM